MDYYLFSGGEKLTLNIIQPYQGKCKDCKSTVTQNKAKYCHGASSSHLHFDRRLTVFGRMCIQARCMRNMR